jgi:hypothetical protein
MNIKTLSVAALIALSAPIAASAATINNVTAPVTEGGLVNGSIYGTDLVIGDIASVDVDTDTDETTSILGFNTDPADTSKDLVFSLNRAELSLYGEITAYLSTSVSTADALVFGTSVGGDLELVTASGSPIYVILEWSNEVANSFSYDVIVAPVPLPAAGWLLIGGLGGLAAMKRRKKA